MGVNKRKSSITVKWKTILVSSILASSLVFAGFPAFGEAVSIKDLDQSSSYAREAISGLAGKNILTGDSHGNNRDDILALPSKDKELTPEEIAAFGKSVVMVQTYDEAGEPVSRGSAFAVAKGLFLTNYYVLEGADRYSITDSSGKTHEIQGIAKYDPDLGLAIIKAKEPLDLAPLNAGTKNNVEKADGIAVIDGLNGQQNTISRGIVSGIRSFEYGAKGRMDILQITAPLTENSFGGALLDRKGKVIGVVSSMSEDGNLKFAVAIDHAMDWIRELQGETFEDIEVLDMRKITAGYLDVSDEGIKALIYKAFRAMEERDIYAYMSTVDPLSPLYKQTQEEMGKVLALHNFDFDILELDVVEKDFGSAEVDVVYTIRRVGMQEADSLRIYGQYSLLKYNGQWRIYLSSELLQQYSKEIRYDTGIGGITKEEALWAYEETTGNQPPAVNINGTALRFEVTDSVLHPAKPVIYFSDMQARKVYSYNYATGQTKETGFSLPPESIAFAGDELYVALLKGEHSPYGSGNGQEGAIAVIDSETLQIKAQVDVAIDPFDIVPGRDGYIYVTSGSGTHTQLKSYSRETLKEVSSTGINGESYAALHPTRDIIYTTNNTSPMDIIRYNISLGKFTDPVYPGGLDSPYQGNYDIGRKFIFSPDGNYLISSAGTIFSTGSGNFGYHSAIGREFTDIAFSSDSKRFFTGVKGGLIYEYTYPDLKPANTYKVQGEIVRLFCRDSRVLAVTKAGGRYYLETVEY